MYSSSRSSGRFRPCRQQHSNRADNLGVVPAYCLLVLCPSAACTAHHAAHATQGPAGTSTAITPQLREQENITCVVLAPIQIVWWSCQHQWWLLNCTLDQQPHTWCTPLSACRLLTRLLHRLAL
jgi:hypothetical protein